MYDFRNVLRALVQYISEFSYPKVKESKRSGKMFNILQ